MLLPHSIAGMPPRLATAAEAGRQRRARGLFRRATSGSGLQTSGSYWGSSAPTQCLCQLRQVDTHVFGESLSRAPGPVGRSRVALAGTSGTHTGVHRPRAPGVLKQ